MAWRFSGTKDGLSWRSALACQTLGLQVDAMAPGRSTATDGTVASSTHSATNPTSDHEPGKPPVGIVAAIDITHDPANGADMAAVAEAIRVSRDPRVKYVIHDHEIFSSYDHANGPPYTWRPYSGSNPHTSHVHVSVLNVAALYDDPSPWSIGTEGADDMPTIPIRYADGMTTYKGVTGRPAWAEEVRVRQYRLAALGYDIGSDGADGKYGDDTKDAVLAFITAESLKPPGGGTYDGKVWDGLVETRMDARYTELKAGGGGFDPDHGEHLTADDVRGIVSAAEITYP